MIYMFPVNAAPDEISYATDGVSDYKVHAFHALLFLHAIYLENTFDKKN